MFFPYEMLVTSTVSDLKVGSSAMISVQIDFVFYFESCVIVAEHELF